MVERRTALAEQARDIERRTVFASEDVQRASAALEQVERRHLRGENVSDAETRKAESALAKAKAEAAQPWTERRAGGRAALRDTDAAISAYIGEHYDSLASEITEDAEATTERVNAALAELAAAHREREQVAARFLRLIGHVARPQAGAIAWTRCEPVVRAAERVIEQGGETPPLPVRGARLPTKGEPAREVVA